MISAVTGKERTDVADGSANLAHVRLATGAELIAKIAAHR